MLLEDVCLISERIPAQDPALVVASIEDAVTDAVPSMWYYPGYAANVAR